MVAIEAHVRVIISVNGGFSFMGELFTPTHLIVVLFLPAIIVVPFWQIFKKAGFPAALSLLMICPLVNLIMLFVLGFSKWRVVPAESVGV
jgi:hypothetical protein